MTAVVSARTETPGACSTRSAVLLTFRDPVGYREAWLLQQQFHAERVRGSLADTLLLLQHLPVYTAGRRTKTVHFKPDVGVRGDSDVPTITVNRGGSVTYHGPGQLVGYPILALSRYASGAKHYVRMLEEVLIRTLRTWDISGYRLANTPGIWVRDERGEAKIASIGARIDRGVTLHGFALNVSTDLIPFSRIVPCGLEGCRMTSMVENKITQVSIDVVAEELATMFSSVFQVEWTHSFPDGLIQEVMKAGFPGFPPGQS